MATLTDLTFTSKIILYAIAQPITCQVLCCHNSVLFLLPFPSHFEAITGKLNIPDYMTVAFLIIKNGMIFHPPI